jgi:glutamate carboxypeptidase
VGSHSVIYMLRFEEKSRLLLAKNHSHMENIDMSRSIARQIRAFSDDNQERIVELIKELVLIETPTLQTETHPKIHEVLIREFSSAGYSCLRKRGKTSGGLLYCRPAERTRNRESQLILGHCDTVWDIGTLREKMPLIVDGNIMKGPGVYDMKAGLAQAIYALKALKELCIVPAVTPVVLISSDEELGSDDSLTLIKTLSKKVKRVLIPEPSFGDAGSLKTSRKGVGRYEIRITGKAAHSGLEPEKGISAVVVLADVIKELSSLSDYSKGISVNVGVVEGGTRENVVPAESRALVDVRARTTSDAWKIDQSIKNIQPTLPGAVIEVLGGIDRPPMEKTKANQALWKKAERIGEELGLDLKGVESGGASDGNFTSEFAATLDGLGPVGGGAHALHEFIRLDKVSERTSLLAMLLMED